MTTPLPEIAVMWEPRHPQSTVFHNVPKGQVREAEFSVYTRVGGAYPVEVLVPNVPWLRLATPLAGPQDPPMHATIVVDTSSLPEGRQYTADLLFRAYGEIIWREPIRVTVAPDNLARPSQRNQPADDTVNGWVIVAGLVIAVLFILFVLSAMGS